MEKHGYVQIQSREMAVHQFFEFEEDTNYTIDDHGCWLWSHKLNRQGYGIFSGSLAHRIYYQKFSGSIRDEYHIHHRCEVKACINPDHLESLSASAHAKAHKSDVWIPLR